MSIEKQENVAVAAILDAYERAYYKSITRITQAKRSDGYAYKKAQTALLNEVTSIFSKMRDEMGAALFKGMENMSALADGLAQLESKTNEVAAGDVLGAPNLDIINAAHTDAFDHVAAQTNRMTRAVKEALRQDAREIFRRATVDGMTAPQAYRAIRNKVLERDPDFRFVDKRGRRWENKDYFEMLARTVLKNVHRDTYVDALAKRGRDLVKVSAHGTQCRLCGPWEGAVLSLSGSTPGYPTLSDAEGGGLFHPRCRHRLTAYHLAKSPVQRR